MRTLLLLLAAVAPYSDHTHVSHVFGGERHYRILLPAGYEASGRHYPVIYYFHGHSDRYTLEKYDEGNDTIPKMAAWVAAHEAIVVCVDGYVAEHYSGFYGGAPWDVMREGGRYDFGEYFLELVDHIDHTYRTLADRRHRATSGLSMGGFMSLYLSARYPDAVGSASAFNPGPEFFTGEAGRRVLWRPKDHVATHMHTMVRLVRASGDYISQYHEETHDAYARDARVDFEFRQDEYHRHWATSIAETFDFHARAFANAALDGQPETWDYASAYRRFAVHGYDVAVESAGAGLVYFEEVRKGALRVRTRQWAPDGPLMERTAIRVATAPVYSPGASYRMLDYNLRTGATRESIVNANAEGVLMFAVDGDGHQVSFVGPGVPELPPLLLPVTPRVAPAADVALPLRIYNPRGTPMRDVELAVTSEYPTVRLVAGKARVAEIAPGHVAAPVLTAHFASGAGAFSRARLRVEMRDASGRATSGNVDVQIAPEVISEPIAYEVLDGRTRTFRAFRQAGNQGGGGSIARTVTEGRGNGNGVLEPGEEATIWVRLTQGMDPFDKGNWYRTKIYADSPWLTEIGDIEEPKQREWTGAQERTSLVRLSESAPEGAGIPLWLDNESWSFAFTPDVRYGREPLYQAFQLHTHHVHRIVLRVGQHPLPAR